MYLIVGLGNYEEKYFNTYHNLGFMAVDRLAKKLNFVFSKSKCRAKYGETIINGEKVMVAKPTTFMNLSGESVSEFARMFKIPNENIIIIYDDIDLEKGSIRFKKSGSGGSHNGMKNVVSCLSSQNIPRIRIGSGKPKEHEDLISFVLSKINKESIRIISPALDRVCDIVEQYVITSGNIDNINK